MKTKVLFVAIFAFAALYVMRCTGAVAPKQEGTSAGKAVEDTSTETSTAKTTVTDTTSDTASDTSSDTTSDTSETTNTETSADPLGEITETTNELGFTPKSAYLSYTAASKYLSLTITESEFTTDSLKVVKSYACKDCVGTDDPHCVTAGGATPKSISVSFTGGSGTAVDADGYPNADDITLGAGTGISFLFSGTASDIGTTGTLGFNASGRPAAVTDDIDVDLDLTFTSGNKYVATVKTSFLPTQTATYPTCGDGKYADPTYEE